MRKKITLSIDSEAYDGIKELPKKVSISEVVSWVVRSMVEGVKPNGMTPDEFIDYMDRDKRGREVRQYLKEKLGPILGPKELKGKLKKRR